MIRTLLAAGAALLLLTGCGDVTVEEETSTGEVTVSGTLTYPAWTQNNYYAVMYPAGIPIGPTGHITSEAYAGTGMTAAYSLSVAENTGDVIVFGFNDDDGGGSPSGANDGSACSGIFTVGSSDVTGIDIALAAMAYTNCPL
jgi:hypothetical protein